MLRAAERASGRAGWLAPPGGVGLSGGAGRLGRWRAGLRGMGRAERGQTGGEAGRGGAGPVSRAKLGRWELGRAERVFGFSGFGLSF